MVNVQYVFWGQLVLFFSYWRGHINTTRNNCSLHGKIAVMALLDALAGFLAAMGARQTSGALQQMLNQTLIPLTMFTGWLFLGKRSGRVELVGAAVIFSGAVVVLLPQLVPSQALQPHQQDAQERGLSKAHVVKAGVGVLSATLLYASSNVPTALSGVYKELSMGDTKVNVIYLTQWVSVYQLLWGICLMPVQAIPGFGSDEGMSIQESLHAMRSGWDCFLQRTQRCHEQKAGWVLLAYLLVNFSFNLMGA